MHRGQRDHPYQAPRGLATAEQSSGAQRVHAHQMSLSSSNKPDPFASSQKQPFQRHIDGYFATASGKSPQRKLNSNTLSEYFTENKETIFPGTKDLTTTSRYNNINDGFEDLDVQMTEMMDDDGSFVMQPEKLQLPQTVPNISSAMNTLDFVTDRRAPQYQQRVSIKGAPMPRVSANHGSGGIPQRVPVMNTHRGTTVASKAVRGLGRANGTGAEKNKDPNKAVSGGIRLRSIHYATSVQQVLGGSMDQTNTVDDEHNAAVVLVEVIGTLCTTMVYSDFCWNFSIRDPTRQDYMDRHPLSPPPSMAAAPVSTMAHGDGPQSVSCQLFDMGNTLNLEILEQGELVRIIGIASSAVKHERETEREKEKEKETKLLATADEARLAIEGSTRCPPPKSD
ncbi:hypothetical protein BG005_007311 [Podila minutissima]|nr:hypothetical protein BG005_007311 [Podila minutissima]